MRRLQVLGWWFNDDAPGPLPRPQLLVRPWHAGERTAVVEYLRAGKPLVTYPEPSFCRFGCGEARMGRADLTDGTFVWPEGLAHYVELHGVALPPPFIARAVAAAGRMPAFQMPKPSFGLFATGPWLTWASEQRACLDLDGFEIPTGDVLERVATDLGPVPHEAILLCRGASREVVLAVGGGAIELRQLRPGGRAPQRFAGWHEWPLAVSPPRGGDGAAKPLEKPGRGVPMAQFFAERLRRQVPDEP